MNTKTESWTRKKSSYVVAMVMGTALTAAMSSTLSASEVQAEISQKSLTDVARYCTACWRNARLPADQWNDCTQDVICRLLQRVPPKEWAKLLRHETEERRELVRAIDTIKKRAQRQKKWTPHPLDTCPDPTLNRREQINEQRATVEQTAKEKLSPRQQRIIEMSLDGWSVQQISEELDVPAERVSDEKYKAIRKLRTTLA